MRAKPEHREAARLLRADGTSLKAIADQLGVAKSSVSVWVRDVGLPPEREAVRFAPGALPVRRLPVWDVAATRTCGRCRHTLPIAAFNRCGDGHQWYCRACFKLYHRGRGRRTVDQSNAARERRAVRSRAHVFALLERCSCTDCGEADLVVLEFDHVRGKGGDVTTLMACGASVDQLDAEIARCEVVCVNCHRRRTATRADWLRARPTWREELTKDESPVARNLRFIYDHLSGEGCLDCGTQDLVVLDFDHEGPKRFNVTRGAWNGLGLSRLEDEIAVCSVRCTNCHRRKTVERGRHRRWALAEAAAGH